MDSVLTTDSRIGPRWRGGLPHAQGVSPPLLDPQHLGLLRDRQSLVHSTGLRSGVSTQFHESNAESPGRCLHQNPCDPTTARRWSSEIINHLQLHSE